MRQEQRGQKGNSCDYNGHRILFSKLDWHTCRTQWWLSPEGGVHNMQVQLGGGVPLMGEWAYA